MYAAMDIGTNSCRLLLANSLDEQKISIIDQHLRTTRIGAGMGSENIIRPEAIERTLSALEEFAVIMGKYSIQKSAIVATQAVRIAQNKNQLVQAIKDKLNWDLEIISGEREARLSYKGATSDLTLQEAPLVIDIGGGSTEFIQVKKDGQMAVLSIPLGGVKLLENPLTSQELAQAVNDYLAGQGFKDKEEDRSHCVVGVGGTCTTLAAVDLGLKQYNRERVQGHRIKVDTLQEIYRMLAKLSTAERLEVAGIYPGREDIIIPGLQILLAILTYLDSSRVAISDRDLLCGLAYEMVSSRPFSS